MTTRKPHLKFLLKIIRLENSSILQHAFFSQKLKNSS